MKVKCPACNTMYRLTKVPSAKVMATCKKCGQKFHIEPPNVRKADIQNRIRQPEVQPKNVIKQSKPQKGRKANRPHDGSRWYERKGLVLVLTLLVTGVVAVGIDRLYNDSGANRKAAQESRKVEIDFFGDPPPESVNVNGNSYTLIDDYIEWIRILYQDRDFEAIEKHISNLLQANNEKQSYELQTLYRVISEIRDSKYIDQMQSVLDEWCSKRADSHIPWLLRGSFHIEYAWLIRGGGFAKTVKKEAWPKFHEKLGLAKNDLEQSWNLNPHDPNSSSLLIEVAIGLRFAKEKMEQYFQNGISACPWHFGLHFEKLRYLKPKWYGSKKEMVDFAEQCLASSDRYPYLGLVMVDALYETHKYSEGENFLGRDDIWATVEKIYAAFFAKYPNDIRRRSYYAYHAHKAEKYEVTYEQFETIGDRWMEHTYWSSLEYYNKCRAIAYIKKGEEFLLKKRLYEISIDYFQKAVKYNPDHYACYRLGQAYMCSGMTIRDLSYLEQAEENLKKAIQLGGSNSRYAKGELRKLRRFMRKTIF